MGGVFATGLMRVLAQRLMLIRRVVALGYERVPPY